MTSSKQNILSHLEWEYLKSQDEIDFQHLCAEFMRIYFNLPYAPPDGGNNYKGTEGPPVKGADGRLYGFQSKFGIKPFLKDLIVSFENISDGTEVYCVFTQVNYPDPAKTTTKISTDLKSPQSNKEYWDWATEQFKKTKGLLEVHYFCGNKFLNQIKGYPELCDRYFNSKDLEAELFEDFEDKASVDQNEIDKKKEYLLSCGIDGNCPENDKEIATIIEQSYLFKKLAYINTNFLIEKFNDFENEVADKTFPLLEFTDDHQNMFGYLDNGVKNMEDSRLLMTKYEALINNLDSKRGVFAHYLADKKAELHYSEKVKFIPKI